MNARRAFVGAVIALPIIALLGYGMTRDPRDIPSPLPGRSAPLFSLVTFTGAPARAPDTVSLRALRGKVVVLNFWASWCLACRSEHDALLAIGNEYRDTADVKFYGVLYNDSPQNGLRWIEQMGGDSYPSLLDPDSKVAIDYGLYGVPETYFIGRDGKVAYKQTGPVTAQLLVSKIEQLRREPAGGGE